MAAPTQRTPPFSHPFLSALIVSLAIALLLPLAGEAADPISLPVSTLAVPAGAADASLILQVHVEGTGAEKAPTVIDQMSATVVPSVHVEAAPQGVRSGADVFDWYFQLSLGKIPAKLTQERQLLISAVNTSARKKYILTNQSFVWAVKSSALTWPVRGGTGLKYPLGIVQGPASRVHIAFCRLDGKSPFDCSRLQLCTDSPESCKKDIDLAEAQSSLSLRLDESNLQPGTYKGSVYLSADERSDPESFPLELSYTSLPWQLLGLLLIAAGVALGWLVTVYARSRISRDRALLAVADFDAAAKSMEEKLATLPPALAGSVTATKQAIADLRLSFTPTNLDQHNFLPTLFGGLGDSTPYQAFLTATGPHISMLKVIVDGMLAAVAIPATPTPADPHPYQRVLGALDLLDSRIQPPAPDAARHEVQTQLASLQNPPAVAMLAVAPSAPPSPQSLLLDISHVNWMAWIAWLVLTIVVGYLVQVDKPGFGTPLDLITCLLWGFGIPAAGMQLGQLTPTSVATTLKIPAV